MTDKFARHDWVTVRKEVQSERCAHYSAILPSHVHNKFEYGRVRKIEHQLDGEAIYTVRYGDGCEIGYLADADLHAV